MHKADNLTPFCAVVTKSGSLNFLEPSDPLQACNGTALPLHVSSILWWWGSFKGKATNASSGDRFSGGRGGLCWLAGFCLVVDLKCGFVETVVYPMGSALYILCNTLLARNVVCCIFVLCCFYTIITLFLWRQLASLFVMLDSAGDQAWHVSIHVHYAWFMIIDLLNCYICLRWIQRCE